MVMPPTQVPGQANRDIPDDARRKLDDYHEDDGEAGDDDDGDGSEKYTKEKYKKYILKNWSNMLLRIRETHLRNGIYQIRKI